MILSGKDIQRYVEERKLRFEPELVPDQYQQNGVDLVLAAVQKPVIGLPSLLSTPSISPPLWTLGCTREIVTLPADLMAFVQLRSTWARQGIILPPTVVDAGFSGQITLEIAAFLEVKLPVGQRFAHLIFARLESEAEPYRGKYQNQVGITGPISD